MSVRATSAVWEHSLMEGSHRLVMLALADHADDAGRCWPGHARLAVKCRVSRDTIKRAVADAERSGELEITHEVGKVNRYRLVLPGLLDPVQDAPTHQAQAAPGLGAPVHQDPVHSYALRTTKNHQEPSASSEAGAGPVPPQPPLVGADPYGLADVEPGTPDFEAMRRASRATQA